VVSLAELLVCALCNSFVPNCQNLCLRCAPHKYLDDDARENGKSHLWLYGNMSLYSTGVEGVKVRCCLLFLG